MSYEILPHTADIGIEARATEVADVFAEAARGLAAIVLDASPSFSDDSVSSEDIRIEGGDLEDTFVKFLEECLYRYETTGMLVVGAALKHVSPTRAEGEVFVVEDPEAAGPMIKAVTYHGLLVQRTATGWMARCYLDV